MLLAWSFYSAGAGSGPGVGEMHAMKHAKSHIVITLAVRALEKSRLTVLVTHWVEDVPQSVFFTT